MIIIGVSGGSGSGKSTFSDLLGSKITNSIVLHVDNFMIKHLLSNKNKIIDELVVCDDGSYWLNNVYDNQDDVLNWINILVPFINNDIEKFIKNCDTDVLIIDGFLLPFLGIFSDCDYSFFIDGDLDIKLSRLVNRLKFEKRLSLFTIDVLINRVKYTSFSSYQYTYRIIHNGKLDDFDYYINEIADKLN